MVHSWQTIELFVIIVCSTQIKAPATPSDWRVIEAIAEEHPYIVALLNSTRSVICSGTVISEHAVLTSGTCIKHDPQFVAVGLAIFESNSNNNSIFPVSTTSVHRDYIFELTYGEPNLTSMHSNIGVVLTDEKYFLEIFFDRGDIGNYYASELRDKQFTVLGYGLLQNSEVAVLQKQWFHQSPCLNPKWYYCVCGYEYVTELSTYESEFGEGAPVLYESEVVAVTAVPCGSLTAPISGIRYNIFTVIGPYRPWIDQPHQMGIVYRSSCGYKNVDTVLLQISYLLLVINELLY